MRIRVQDGHPAQAPGPSRLAEGDDHIVEAAVAPEEIPPGVMPARPDEAKGVAQLARSHPPDTLHHASHGDARGASERIRLDLGDQRRIVGQKD